MASTKFTQTNSNFALGEVSGELSGRGDLKTAAFGLSKLENMDIISSGGIRRRCGTASIVGELGENARIVPMKLGNGSEYLLLLENKRIKIFKDGAQTAMVVSRWSAAHLPKLQIVQMGDSIVFAHPDVIPSVLSFLVNGTWRLVNFNFETENGNMRQPWHKFEGSNFPFVVSNITAGGSRSATLTAQDGENWTPDCMYSDIRFAGIDFWITQYVSPREVRVTTNDSKTIPTGTISDWTESAFSDRRGWPRSAAVYQNRLVLAGNTALPNFLWMSKTGKHYNFDTGTGLDNESVCASLMGGSQHSIVSVQSGENLEVLTDLGEWSIKGMPITPGSLSVRQHTNIGSSAAEYVPPQRVDGATIFVSKNAELRELRLDNLSDSYSTTDLSAVSKHLMTGTRAAAYHQPTKRLMLVQKDGRIAVLKKDDNLEILGWSTYGTDGRWMDIAVVGGKIYTLVERGDETFLEVFDEDKMTDGADEFAYAHTAAAMPLFSDGAPARLARLTKWKARVVDSANLKVRLNGGEALEIPIPETPGIHDVSAAALGTCENARIPLWEISGSEPKPLTILSITIEGRISI